MNANTRLISIIYRVSKRVLPNYDNNCLLYYRQLSTIKTAKNDYFITAPIFYVNSEPHIGHLYTAILCDVQNRWQSLCGRQSKFMVGTDEHGIKIQQAAARSGIPPQQHCDRISETFKNLFREGNIEYTDFIRTTDQRHIEAVHTFWKTLVDNGLVYKGSYEGWYSVADEAYLTDLEVTDGVDATGNKCKVSCTSGHRVEWMSESNYMFRLSHFTEQISQWCDKKVIRPVKFEGEVRAWLRDGLPDLSVSRERSRLPWGIPVPGDDSHTIYVWLDALVSYLTVSGYPHPQHTWPPHCQVIGKDILRFHAVYWPAFLLGAGLSLPDSILCHSHWLHDGRKMSKSLGNVVEPVERLREWGSDGLRYFLMKEAVPHSDANYSDNKLVEYVNSDLVNTLGNLLSRCTSRAVNPLQIYPPFDSSVFADKFAADDREFFRSLPLFMESVTHDYNTFNTHRVIDAAMARLRWANSLVQTHEPWHLAKSPDHAAHLRTLLRVAMETLRACGVVLSPIVPDLCDKLRCRLGVADEDWCLDALCLRGEDLTDWHELGPASGNLLDRIKLMEFTDVKEKRAIT